MLKNDELISCLSHGEAEILVVMYKPDTDILAIKKAVGSLRKVVFIGEPIGQSWEVPLESLMGHQGFSSVTIDAHDPRSRTALPAHAPS